MLDLDETLIHTSDFKPNNQNISFSKINWKNSSNKSNETAYTWIRPGAHQFLSQVSKLFKVCIFTASMPGYAKEVMKLLDHQDYCFPLFSRENCIFQDGKYIKDLSVVSKELKHTIIVDNSPDSYCFNKRNGVPITSWFGEPYDNELDKISVVLEFLSKVNDVREYIPKFIINNRISMSRLLCLCRSTRFIKAESTNPLQLFKKIKSDKLAVVKDESTKWESNDSNKVNSTQNMPIKKSRNSVGPFSQSLLFAVGFICESNKFYLRRKNQSRRWWRSCTEPK